MKHIKKISHLALFIISLVFIAPTQAAVFEIQRVASTDSLNLRAKPGARNAIVGRVPHNGKWIRTDGRRVAVGRTQWIKINWRGRVGWVNERYVRQMVLNKAPQPTTVAPTTTPQAPRPAAAPTPPPLPPSLSVAALHKKGAWVLECGNKSPFWRVIVHPGKALEVNLRGRNAGVIPMTYQKQDKNKWNTALKTVVKASNGRFGTHMTIRYTKQCRHTLSNQNVPYRVKAIINQETVQGCCRALQLP